MRPSRDDDAVVDLLDAVLRNGVVVEADVIVTVADIALVGISIRAAIAGMTTMTQYGVFEERDAKSTGYVESSRVSGGKSSADGPSAQNGD